MKFWIAGFFLETIRLYVKSGPREGKWLRMDDTFGTKKLNENTAL
jgi:hypothetical protein